MRFAVSSLESIRNCDYGFRNDILSREKTGDPKLFWRCRWEDSTGSTKQRELLLSNIGQNGENAEVRSDQEFVLTSLSADKFTQVVFMQGLDGQSHPHGFQNGDETLEFGIPPGGKGPIKRFGVEFRPFSDFRNAPEGVSYPPDRFHQLALVSGGQNFIEILCRPFRIVPDDFGNVFLIRPFTGCKDVNDALCEKPEFIR